jgi:hypothetical protein
LARAEDICNFLERTGTLSKHAPRRFDITLDALERGLAIEIPGAGSA